MHSNEIVIYGMSLHINDTYLLSFTYQFSSIICENIIVFTIFTTELTYCVCAVWTQIYLLWYDRSNTTNIGETSAIDMAIY